MSSGNFLHAPSDYSTDASQQASSVFRAPQRRKSRRVHAVVSNSVSDIDRLSSQIIFLFVRCISRSSSVRSFSCTQFNTSRQIDFPTLANPD